MSAGGMSGGAPWRVLADAVARHYRNDAAIGGAGARLTERGAAALENCGEPRLDRASALRKPVRRFMPEIAALAARSPLRIIVEAFAAVEPSADWLQNPNYTEASVGRTYLDAYGYVEFAGPGRVFECPDLRLGLLLLGPDLHYRDHSHPAEEIYHVVAGTAAWSRAGSPWCREPPGAAIHHPPNLSHATKTGAEPLLALYCWGGEIAAHARFAGNQGKDIT